MFKEKYSEKDKTYMRLAIEKAKAGIKKGQTPFGACIVKAGRVVGLAHNKVWDTMDITAHAEITAIRQACKALKTVSLKGCVIYSTCEPCPMCFSACHWAGISKIVYGANINDAKKAGFNELAVSNQRLIKLSQTAMKSVCGCLRNENRELFGFWQQMGLNKVY